VLIVLALCTVISVCLVSPPPEFLFAYSKGECAGRTVMMYNALYRKQQTFEMSFFGSSKMLNGISDSLLNKKAPGTALNLGHCRFGRNLDEFFVEQFLKNNKCKKIILEVRDNEGEGIHPSSPFLLNNADFFRDELFSLDQPFNMLYARFLVHLKYLRSRLFKNEYRVPEVEVNNGFWTSRGQMDKKQLDQIRTTNFNDDVMPVPLAGKDPMRSFSRIAEISRKAGVQLYFLYLPPLGKGTRLPGGYLDLVNLGKLILLPASISDNAGYYSDENHFNRAGALAATGFIEKLMRQY
jgi:hypothetical protein